LTDSVGESTLSSNSNEDDDEMHNNSISKSGESSSRSSSSSSSFESKKLSKKSKSLPITLATPVAAANKSPAESPSVFLKSPVAKNPTNHLQQLKVHQE
jgi:hypothetical protein